MPSLCSTGESFNRNHFDKSGTTVIATTSEKSKEMTIVQASGANIFPTTPGTKAIGKNTATVVIVEDVIAAATSLVASSTSCSLRSFAARTLLKTFSMTTIESSTTLPTATAIPARVMIFKV